jgi:ADP-ribose pyrophosphatase YjhB (NUDIX family)
MDLSKNRIDATLVFPVKEKGKCLKVLLTQKVRKLLVNCFNGFGGPINKRETPKACAVRELREESGFIAMEDDLEFVGVVIFHNQREDYSKFDVKVFIFILKKWRKRLKLKEDEMVNSKWFKTYRLPKKRMAPGDKKFVPQILNNTYPDKIVRGEIWYSPGQKKMLGYDIKWVAKTGDVD